MKTLTKEIVLRRALKAVEYLELKEPATFRLLEGRKVVRGLFRLLHPLKKKIVKENT